MITFTHDTTRFTVKPENAQEYRKLAAKPPAIKCKIDAKHNSMKRDYPEFYVGMETGDYLSRYASLNNRLLLSAWKFDYADRAAPMLDATQPEALEELDADYVPPPPKVKKGKARAVHLIKCIRDDLLFYTDNPAEFSPEYFYDLLRCADEALENLT
jgi:hypothetical protein